MFRKIKYFVSAVFSTDAKFPPPPPPPPKKIIVYAFKNIFRSLKVKRYRCLRKMLQNLRVTEALYTLHRSGNVIMLIYEKVKETTAHLPSDRPIKIRHLEVTI